jgi:S-DNA-T family DNA segregation ATPase FtsK/SpoIIIE
LLEKKEEVPESGDIRNNIQIIKRTLANFGISVEVEEITIGPTITRYGIKLAEGIKISKVLALQNDLALNLAAQPIRIEAPIAGKSLIGIEVPNQKIAKVRLRALAEESEFLENESSLYLPIGRMVAGEPLFSDLSLMPHLLIAGTTGSGKSMFIHSLILSFLLRNTPETLNFILVDPKRIELVRYENIPHLIMEPILDSKKVLAVMQWLIREMEGRFVLLQENKARDLNFYNKIAVQKQIEVLPRIVLVIDEMADLMLSHGASLEASIVRLTQMARATGIHLVLATQRPSVDVITGLIKANIPNRICFKVASQIDSRTVLDFGGAEKLLGSGDMLFVSTRFIGTKRIQAPLVSEKEIHNITKFWKDAAVVNEENDTSVRKIDLSDFESLKEISGDEDDDELIQEAYRLVVDTGKASTSFLQRKLRIGYGRAARLLDLLEEKGVVGPTEGTKPRKVLMERPEEL